MRLPSLLQLALLATLIVTVWAAPYTANRPRDKPKVAQHLATKPVAPEPSSKELVAKLDIILGSCKPHRPKPEKALADRYTIAKKEQEIKETDVAFTNHFIPGNPVRPFRMTQLETMSLFPMNPEHIQDSKMVSSMFTSILTGGAFVNKSMPTVISFCPLFFDLENPSTDTEHDLDDYEFSTNPSVHNTWCLEAPHVFGHLVTAGHTVLHEVAHLPFIVFYAIELSLGQMLPETVAKKVAGTLDIYRFSDENDPGNMATYGGYLPAASRTLKRRWAAYFTLFEILLSRVG
ncbi:hypothetical protein BT96DRAFT_996776 [Gymnopus androsaceus JB14]|uniref:Uncharacterized protein n=1 Tax=Gymnopus androsaceus JB14 TaxID=1447944 RepID=A0A6A4HGZ9_9AGAR|nr:hypothetical protein BT96DRAFT_996776 [Gymnopus androsaceus JB14]